MVAQETLNELGLLFRAPILVPEIWWIITPLIFLVFILTFYFGKYIKEELGWNTALSNSIVLVFICIDLLRTIYHYTQPASVWNFAWHPEKVAIIFFIMLEGMLLSYTAFKHALPKWVMFFIASPASVNSQAYILTTIIYLQIEPTIYTLYAALVFLAILIGTITLIREGLHIIYGYHFNGKKKK